MNALMKKFETIIVLLKILDIEFKLSCKHYAVIHTTLFHNTEGEREGGRRKGMKEER